MPVDQHLGGERTRITPRAYPSTGRRAHVLSSPLGVQALLAGFAWYGLTEVPFDQGADVYTQTLYLVVTTLIMGLELLTVVNATLCAILGPGLVRSHLRC